jgi:hypothetical protein
MQFTVSMYVLQSSVYSKVHQDNVSSERRMYIDIEPKRNIEQQVMGRARRYYVRQLGH